MANWWDEPVAQHIKHCKLCRQHDRHVGAGEKYTPKQELAYRTHLADTIARIKEARRG